MNWRPEGLYTVYPHIIEVIFYPSFLVIILISFVITRLSVGLVKSLAFRKRPLVVQLKVMTVVCQGVQKNHIFPKIFCDG